MTKNIKTSAETIVSMSLTYLQGTYDEDLYITVLENFVRYMKEEKSKSTSVEKLNAMD